MTRWKREYRQMIKREGFTHGYCTPRKWEDWNKAKLFSAIMNFIGGGDSANPPPAKDSAK